LHFEIAPPVAQARPISCTGRVKSAALHGKGRFAGAHVATSAQV
jgi:hypothetical protein